MQSSKTDAIKNVEILDKLLTAFGNPYKTDEDHFLICKYLDYESQQQVAAYARVGNYEGCRRFLVNKILDG